MVYLLDGCINMRESSTLLHNLLFVSLTVLLTGCITSGAGAGGSYQAGGNPSFPGQPGTFTCDGASGQYAEFYCDTGEHPNMCDC